MPCPQLPRHSSLAQQAASTTTATAAVLGRWIQLVEHDVRVAHVLDAEWPRSRFLVQDDEHRGILKQHLDTHQHLLLRAAQYFNVVLSDILDRERRDLGQATQRSMSLTGLGSHWLVDGCVTRGCSSPGTQLSTAASCSARVSESRAALARRDAECSAKRCHTRDS